MKREIVLIFSGLTLLSLAVGYYTGLLIQPGTPRFSPASPTPTLPALVFPTATTSAQTGLLFIGVDSLTSSKPRLEMVWVVIFEPGLPNYYAIVYSPHSRMTVPAIGVPLSLREVYDLDTQFRRGNVFTRDGMRELTPGLLPIKGEVIFDRQILVQAVDRLGGLHIQGDLHNGQGVLSLLEAVPEDDPNARLDLEAAIMRAVLQTASDNNWSALSLLAYVKLGQSWNPDYDTLVALVEDAPPLADAQIAIEYAPLSPAQEP